jgi:hypothetical protein
MNKKQLIAVSFVAAIPAAALLAFLVLGLLQGMLSDGARVSVVLWIVWVLAALASLSMAFLPFGIMFFPGLMPDPALAAAAGASGFAAAPGKKSSQPAEADEFEEGEGEFAEDTDGVEDDGEQLFDDDAMEDNYDDEYEDFEDRK